MAMPADGHDPVIDLGTADTRQAALDLCAEHYRRHPG
jgi:hypothetical protein